jgi:hypothetical protein
MKYAIPLDSEKRETPKKQLKLTTKKRTAKILPSLEELGGLVMAIKTDD